MGKAVLGKKDPCVLQNPVAGGQSFNSFLSQACPRHVHDPCMASHQGLSGFDAPPAGLREVYKKFRSLKVDALDVDEEILDFARGLTNEQKQNIRVSQWLNQDSLKKSSATFANSQTVPHSQDAKEASNLAYEHKDLPGLFLIPSLLSTQVQANLLSNLVHRDLSNPSHKTNLHLHYDLPYAERSSSFFTYSPSTEAVFRPKYPDMHKPLSVFQALNKKLRWITLGGQYDWTEKRYPAEPPPQFPSDIGALLHGLFPSLTPEAAIVNFYSPGDTLSLHRDVSEESEKGLASLSIGCDGIFIVGQEFSGEHDHPTKSLVVRLRSGDAIFMDGPSRFAWHGVPQIVPGTCPTWLEDWPAAEDRDAKYNYEQWKGWMRRKRVNLNVRQMWN